MLITGHVSSGALIGLVAPSPAAALVAGIASHAALDALPHWGTDGGMEGDVLRVAVADGLTGLALIGAIARATGRRRLPTVLAGVVGACLPDLDKPGQLFFGRSPYPSRVDAWHGRIQREHPHLLRRDAALCAVGGAVAVAVLRTLR